MTDTDFERLSTVSGAQFSLCKPKAGQPCLKYDANRPYELNAFLNAHGGNDARYESDGTAYVAVMVRGESRYVFVKPGSWVRAVGLCQFSACSDVLFRETYDLV